MDKMLCRITDEPINHILTEQDFQRLSNEHRADELLEQRWYEQRMMDQQWEEQCNRYEE